MTMPFPWQQTREERPEQACVLSTVFLSVPLLIVRFLLFKLHLTKLWVKNKTLFSSESLILVSCLYVVCMTTNQKLRNDEIV